MDPLEFEIAPARPDAPELAVLFDRHLTLMRASSPACSVHAMDAEALTEADVRFFVIRVHGKAVGMGALKRISEDHSELKSMHVMEEMRGRGLARHLLNHLMNEACAMGARRISLETGVQPPFAGAHALYASEGFETCPPFEGYGPDPNSTFMTRTLEPAVDKDGLSAL